MEAVTREAGVDREAAESADAGADKVVVGNEGAAAGSGTETGEGGRQTVTVTAAEAVTVTVTETDIRMKRVMNSESRMNIRLLAAIQMMLKVLLISQMSLLHFHADQSDIRQSMFLSHDDIHYYVC